jgi:hypothetical protein
MKYLSLLLFISTIVFSCRSTKSIQNAITKKDSIQVIVPPVADDSRHDSLMFMNDVYSGVEKKRIDFKTFSAKVKVNFEGKDGKKNDFNAFIRLQKDSVLWVSINALLGIEAFRIMITPDSVKVLNKLDKKVQLRSVAYLKEITKLPFTFRELQDLVIGNPIYFANEIISYKKEGERVTVVSIGKMFKHLLTLNPANYEILHSKIDDVDAARARTADITYGDYQGMTNNSFSTFRKITLSEKSKLDIEMKYKQFDFNIPLNFPFSIPKNYKLQ